VNHPQVEMRRARSVAISGASATLVHLDGEPFGSLPVRIALQPACLLVAAAVQ
jgi:diacylglycerol kinase family enzyme